eukprot:2972697-Amphidinium_carterae.1
MLHGAKFDNLAFKGHRKANDGSELNITGWKETTLVIGNIIMQVKFIIANVQSPLIGLPDMDYNELVMHTGAEPTIEQCGYQEPSMKIGSHLYVAAMGFAWTSHL